MDSLDSLFAMATLRAISGATRRESDTWVKRGIISAQTSPGSGHHRLFTFWNLVEATAAKAISSHIRAGTLEQVFESIRSLVATHNIKPRNLLSLADQGTAFIIHLRDSEEMMSDGSLRGQITYVRLKGETAPKTTFAPLLSFEISLATAAHVAAQRLGKLLG